MRLYQRYALQFDGNLRTYIQYNIGTDFQDITSKFTIVGWYKASSTQLSENIYTFSIFDNLAQRIADSDSPSLKLLYRNVSGLQDLGTTAYHILDDSWHMLAMSFNNGNIKIYRDLDKVYEATVSDTSIVHDSTIFYIGGWSNGSYGNYTGLIGEIRFYDDELVFKEIEYLYRGGHIKRNLRFWIFPDDSTVVLDTDGQTVLSLTDQVGSYNGIAYNGVKLVNGKDIDVTTSLGKKFIIVRRV